MRRRNIDDRPLSSKNCQHRCIEVACSKVWSFSALSRRNIWSFYCVYRNWKSKHVYIPEGVSVKKNRIMKIDPATGAGGLIINRNQLMFKYIRFSCMYCFFLLWLLSRNSHCCTHNSINTFSWNSCAVRKMDRYFTLLSMHVITVHNLVSSIS